MNFLSKFSDKTSSTLQNSIAWFVSDSWASCLYHNDTIIQVSSKLWMFLICTPNKTKTFTVRLAVTTNTKQTVLQQRCCLDSRVVPIGPIVRGVIAFPILRTWWDATTQVASQSVHWQASYGISNIFQQRPSAILNLKILIFDHVAVVVVRICCCIPNFIKIGSRIRLPDAHNCVQCAVAMATALWRTCREHDGMWPPKLRHSQSIGRRVMAFRIFSNMAAVRHFEFKKINIWLCDCYCGPNLLFRTKFHQNWFARSASRRP